MGPRFVGGDFETLVYPVADGGYYQTTFAYWQQVLAARATQVGLDSTRATPSTERTGDVGLAVTTDGDSTTAGVQPLRDAWTAASTGGR